MDPPSFSRIEMTPFFFVKPISAFLSLISSIKLEGLYKCQRKLSSRFLGPTTRYGTVLLILLGANCARRRALMITIQIMRTCSESRVVDKEVLFDFWKCLSSKFSGSFSGSKSVWNHPNMTGSLWSSKARVSCQDVSFPKIIGMRNKPQPRLLRVERLHCGLGLRNHAYRKEALNWFDGVSMAKSRVSQI